MTTAELQTLLDMKEIGLYEFQKRALLHALRNLVTE